MRIGRFSRCVATILVAVGLYTFAWAHEKQVQQPGVLVELGKNIASVGFVLDPVKGELTAHVLDGGTGNPARIAQEAIRINGTTDGKPFTLKLLAVGNPLTGEKKWDTSVFRGSDKALEGVGRFEGSIFFIRVGGVNFRKVRFKYLAEDAKME